MCKRFGLLGDFSLIEGWLFIVAGFFACAILDDGLEGLGEFVVGVGPRCDIAELENGLLRHPTQSEGSDLPVVSMNLGLQILEIAIGLVTELLSYLRKVADSDIDEENLDAHGFGKG